MIRALSVAVQLGYLGFVQAFKGETKDGILGLTDTLTKVGNRKAFVARIGKCSNGGVITLKTHGLREYNERYGHSAGNKIVKELVDSIAKALKGRGELFRVSGTGFCVLLDCEDTIELGMIKEVIINKINGNMEITLSADIITMPNGNGNVPIFTNIVA